MAFPPAPRSLLAIACAAIAAAALWASPAAAVTPAPACSSFPAQAGAQDYFAEFGGSPRRSVGNLDDDRDGVACEGLAGPYKPFATIGYNGKRGFFYGTASMPPTAGPEGGFPCLYGNRHFADGPRLLNVYKSLPGPDKAMFGVLGAEARPESGRLLWKGDRAVVTPGRYYAAFEERIPLKPYGANECPGFRSAEVALSQPPRR